MPIPSLKKIEHRVEETVDKVENEFESMIHKPFDKLKARKPFYQKWIFWIIIVFFGIILFSAYIYIRYWQPLKNTFILAQESQIYFEKIQNDLLTADFYQAKEDIENVQNILNRLEKNVNKLESPLIRGYLRNQYEGIQHLVMAVQDFNHGLFLLTNLANDVLADINRDPEKGYLRINPEQRKQILTKFSQKTPELNGAKAQIDLSLINLDQISINQLNRQLADYVIKLRAKLVLLHDFLDKSVSLSQTLPSLLGLNQEKTYLFLLQNYDELRPTGGFIGTIGILKIKDGNITSFTTQNVYDYDKFAHNKLKIEPPEPIKKYLDVEGWYLRDSNWSPDFAESAKKIEWFYHQETALSGGKLRDYQIDGAIAITPQIVKEFLSIVGAIDVDSFVFNKDNFVDQLEYLVEVGYKEQGVEYFQRKDIIAKLSQKIIARTEDINFYGWLEFLKSLFNNLNQKHILIYVKDLMIQDLISEQKWTGLINQTSNDYLLAVDANMAALKSNQCVSRDIRYSLVPEKIKIDDDKLEDKLKVQVDIRYINNCTFTWKSTRYRTYTRVFIPQGSGWIKTTGSMEMDRSSKPGKTDVSEENNKTVLGSFIAVEPGQQGILSFEYYLPNELSNKIYQAQEYNLLIQKQAGTFKDRLFLDLTFPNQIKTTYPSEPQKSWGDNHYQLETDLEADREVKIGF